MQVGIPKYAVPYYSLHFYSLHVLYAPMDCLELYLYTVNEYRMSDGLVILHFSFAVDSSIF